MSENKISFIIDELAKLFPLAKCELDYHNIYELSVAVILSAQTTDKAVNKVTPELFRHYLTVNDLANANYPDVEKIISSIGLSYKKSHYIVDFSKDIMNLYQGQIPNNLDDLIKIKGVGRKTANVILSEGYHLPALAVDVHVARCAKRLGLVENQDDPYKIEMKLKKMIPLELHHIMHHRFIFMGRYLCKSQNPECFRCPFTKICRYYNN